MRLGSFDLPAELAAALFLAIVVALFAVAVVIGDARHARNCRLMSREELQRDQATRERRARLSRMQIVRRTW